MKPVRDTIVIGASSGGVRALRGLLARLPVDLPAAILIVLHRAAVSGNLVSVLGAATKLSVQTVAQPQSIERGRVYVAPPDRHLVIARDQVLTTRGARENRSRPSINVLFRTAAAERAGRVIGVLLTGMLDDGVAGLDAIRRCGGLVVVQDPDEAEYSEMPRHALEAMTADHVAPLADIAELLPKLVTQEAPECEVPMDIAIEAEISGPGGSNAPQLDQIGEHVSLACPECGGPMWKIGKGGGLTYRCHTGHALSARALLESQADEIEHSLWEAVRALSERGTMLTRLAETVEERSPRSAARFRERADEAHVQAKQARDFLVTLRMTRPNEEPLPDDPEVESAE